MKRLSFLLYCLSQIDTKNFIQMIHLDLIENSKIILECKNGIEISIDESNNIGIEMFNRDGLSLEDWNAFKDLVDFLYSCYDMVQEEPTNHEKEWNESFENDAHIEQVDAERLKARLTGYELNLLKNLKYGFITKDSENLVQWHKTDPQFMIYADYTEWNSGEKPTILNEKFEGLIKNSKFNIAEFLKEIS